MEAWGARWLQGLFQTLLLPPSQPSTWGGAVTPTWDQQRAGRSRVLQGHQSPSQSPSIIYITCCRISRGEKIKALFIQSSCSYFPSNKSTQVCAKSRYI